LDGAGNSSTPIRYTYRDYFFKSNDFNYYRLSQTDFNGEKEFFDIIVVNNSDKKKVPTLLHIYNHLGQEVDENHKGFLIYYYDDGSTKKVIKQ